MPIIEQPAGATQASATREPAAVTDFTGQSVLDGFPVGAHVELAAIHVHEEIRILVGRARTLPWLECTAAHRNALRQGVIDLVEQRIDGPVRRV